MIELKSQAEIEKIKVSCRMVAEILEELKKRAHEGMSTLDLDKIAEKMIEERNVKPAFKGYRGFPACLCTSLNNEVVHGIPSSSRKLESGDLLSLDFGVVYDGYYGDSALSFVVGSQKTAQQKKLLKVTEEALYKGIETVRVGNHISDISYAIQSHVEKNGFSVVRDFVGHGIGRSLHEDPQVPNYGNPQEGPVIKEGMVLAIEPMVNVGGYQVEILSDGWTVVTKDKSLSAHFEHTVVVTKDKPLILTERR